MVRRIKSRKNKKKLYSPERIPTGIKGLDKLIEGGFLKGSSILVSGGTGTGKTIFCIQFLFKGLENGESCVYITLEEPAEDIRKDALAIGIDFEKYEKNGKFAIVEHNVFESPSIDFFAVDKLKATRVVIDPFSILALSIEDKPTIRRRLYETIRMLRERGVTLVLTSEIPGTGLGGYSRYNVEEFVVDGVIKLKYISVGPQAGRSLLIKKMRRTKHSEEIHPIVIGKGGIKVLSV